MSVAQSHDTARQKIAALHQRLNRLRISLPVLPAFLPARANNIEPLETGWEYVRITAIIV